MDDERERLIATVQGLSDELHRALTQADLRPLLDSSLTLPQLRLLAVLGFDGVLGGQELARRLGVSTPTVTGMVDRLVARGLVERREAVGDRRVRPVALTEEGELLLERIRRRGRLAGEDLLGRLETADLRALGQGLGALAAVANECRRADRSRAVAHEVSRCPD